jgi:phospholipase C
MALSVADLGMIGDTPVTIQSAQFANIYLRMDGTGVTTTTAPGAGTVNCQYGTDPLTTFIVRPQTDGSFAFESTAFPNVFLRMDGTGVPTDMAGGGVVNCQFGADSYEMYRLSPQPDGSMCFQSATAFPGIWLRMVVGGGVTAATGPGGTVNCQLNANGGAFEKFIVDLA